MPKLCLYFQVHQPWRIKKYRFFDIGRDHDYFTTDDPRLSNEAVLKKVASKCYLPANSLFLELLERYPEFKISYSLSGVFIDQIEKYSPEVLESFVKLSKTGRVEFLDETYYHSLAFLYSKDEFIKQIKLHRQKIKQLFGYTPTVFRNTELIYNNDVANVIEELGYKGIIGEGAEKILGWRNSNFVYRPIGSKTTKLLTKNFSLSDDIAFRFSDKNWSEHPLTAEKFASWVESLNGNGEIVNLFMDYETFGEHQWEDTGIFNFLRSLPEYIFKQQDGGFVTPSEAIKTFEAKDEIDVPDFISWADTERDLSAWLSNPMQHEAIARLYDLETKVLRTKDPEIIEDWRRLQTSDHFYYMCTKFFNDGDVHKYFNPYESPYDAFITFMNALSDLELRIENSLPKSRSRQVAMLT